MCFSFLLSKKGVSKKSSNYQLIAFISCPSKAFEIIINMKVFIHLSASDLSEHQQVLLNRLFTGNHFAATVKPLLLHKSLLSELSFHEFFSVLYTSISNFHSCRSIFALVDGHFRLCDIAVPKVFVLSATLSVAH